MNTAIIDQLRTLLMSFSLPYTINDRTNITEIIMTTVCSLNEMEYQCKCEGLFVWPNDMCHSYETCDNITDGACTCINALPNNGQFCQLKKGTTSIYSIDVDVRFFDSLLVNDLRNLITNISLPLTLNNNINVTDIDMTTVCGLNGTEYECKCEEHHVWSSDTCEVHQVCDDIVGGACGCIQGLPSVGQLCQRDINECEDAESVCGPNSYCSNIIGSHNCSCWSGFAALNRNSPVSLNNPCVYVDKCVETPEICGPNSICNNTDGRYNCSCMSGYNVTDPNLPINNSNPCRDIYECFDPSSVCGPNAHCHNYNGSFSCSCLAGYNITDGNPVSKSNPCIDVDECVETPEICGPNSICNNTDGSYICTCKIGYTNPNLPINNRNPCRDVDECVETPEVCGPNSICNNTDGRHNCSCMSGYNVTDPNLPINNSNPCRDVDECVETPEICGPNSICSNTDGSYNCLCVSGYTNPNLPVKNRDPCRDVDECVETPEICGPNSICSNTDGRYICTCRSGYNVTNQDLPVNNSNPCRANTAPPIATTVVKMSMRINLNFDTGLMNSTDPKYQKYVQLISAAIEESYTQLKNYIKGSVKVTGFRSGSIIADYTIDTTNSSSSSSSVDLSSANTQVSEVLLKEGIPVASNAFEESVEIVLTTKEKFYDQQSMELRCTRPTSVVGTIKWRVNDKDPAGNTGKYTITNDGSDSGSTLKVSDLSESDNGRYSCIIERRTIPYVQWQKVVIEPRPNIIVNPIEIKSPCNFETVTLSCCEERYPIKWDGNSSADQVTISGPGCIMLRHLSTRCETTDIFTCLVNMDELKEFDYSRATVTVKTVNEFDCKNETLGVGKFGDIVKGPCEKGLEGRITYECQRINSKHDWKPIQRECVVEAIQDLERKVEVLVVEEIPEFMSNLSGTAEQKIVEITQSADTVQTIVEILSKIASFSESVTISQPVMADFLKTVDIIVADESKTTWDQLNNGTKTENRSTELLQAIEKISNNLSEDDFTISKTSIQLNRTTIKNSFIGTSQLANSTTQIVIPNVVEPAFITIIVFTKLNNVLPTRNTSKNDNRTSQNRINGDVVVVKVNETINNISFAFDITNTSLGNPQCVFWNFSLDRWDSTGCKVKHSRKEAVTCECTHTTSFSILMSPFGLDHPALAYITYIGVAISMASLILCLIIEMIVWESVKRNNTSHMRHVSIVNIAVSLLIANICFIIGAAIADQDIKQEQMISVGRCSPVVFFMHFFYLALFFWMLVSALFLFYCTVMVFSQISRAKMMIIAFTVGYGAPLLIAVITVASTAGPKNYVSKENACWLNWTESKALLAFVIPALTIFFFNLMVVVVVVCKMLRRGVGAATQPNERHTLVVIARSVAVLTPIFGLTWGFGIGTLVSRELGIHVVFALLNSLQGLFILLFGLLFDSKIRDLLAGRLALRTLTSSDRTRSTTAGPSSSGFDFFRRMRGRRNAYNISEVAASSGVTTSNSYSALDAFGSA
ncbi:adhesion G protein-coupled receptor F5-like isoform X1 [Triplophysa rosa]|nr:adhesion G protein-coupled receptor F5-like isoform X1 [Triplophysa rosa]